MIPVRTVCFKRRPSDPWFDNDCRGAKWIVRCLNRAVRRTHPADFVAATTTWTGRRHHQGPAAEKRDAFWINWCWTLDPSAIVAFHWHVDGSWTHSNCSSIVTKIPQRYLNCTVNPLALQWVTKSCASGDLWRVSTNQKICILAAYISWCIQAPCSRTKDS